MLLFLWSFRVCVRTCHKVSKSYGGQGDDHEVKGVQRRPALDVFEDGRRQRDEEQAAEKHKQQRGDDADLRLTDVPVLQETEGQTEVSGSSSLASHVLERADDFLP